MNDYVFNNNFPHASSVVLKFYNSDTTIDITNNPYIIPYSEIRNGITEYYFLVNGNYEIDTSVTSHNVYDKPVNYFLFYHCVIPPINLYTSVLEKLGDNEIKKHIKLHYFKIASELGSAYAAFSAAYLYDYDQDYLKYMTLAFDRGHSDAASSLFNFYLETHNLEQAAQYLIKHIKLNCTNDCEGYNCSSYHLFNDLHKYILNTNLK